MLCAREQVNEEAVISPESKPSVADDSRGPAELPAAPSSRAGLRTLLAVPVATIIALAVHMWASKNEPALETETYTWFLRAILGIAIAGAAIQYFWTWLRNWMKEMCPIFAAGIVLLTIAEVVT